MKKRFWLVCILLAAVALPAHADDKIALQLKWLDQAQFAGYYVAQKNGYYDDEDLEVTIRPVVPATHANKEFR